MTCASVGRTNYGKCGLGLGRLYSGHDGSPEADISSSYPCLSAIPVLVHLIAVSTYTDRRSSLTKDTMRSQILRLLTVAALALLPLACLGSLYSKGDDVVILTAANYDKAIVHADGVSMVEFYAPWCGHCKNLSPHYKTVAQKLKVGGCSRLWPAPPLGCPQETQIRVSFSQLK